MHIVQHQSYGRDLLLLGLLLLALGCGNDEGTGPDTSGSVEVIVTSTGADIDSDGYMARIGTSERHIDANSSVAFDGLNPGEHEVELTNLAPNCLVSEANPRTVNVVADATVTTEFDVTCSPTTGTLSVTVTTEGDALDPNGYTLSLDGNTGPSVGINGSTSVGDVPPGDRELELTGVASNCEVGGSNPRMVTVAAGGTASTSFGVTCAALPPASPEVVSAGNSHSCTVTSSGVPYCWGSNQYGQLGDGSWSFLPGDPVAVSGALTFRSVVAGGAFTCGVTTTDAAFCWGSPSFGKLGTEAPLDTCNDNPLPAEPCMRTPAPVSGGLTFESVSAGFNHACGLTPDGAAYCWGYNHYGQLGDGTTIDRDGPVPVLGGLTFRMLSGDRYHTCGVTTTGKAYCWGYNADGQLGVGRWSPLTNTAPVAVAGDLTFLSVDAGQHHSCGVTADEKAYCWGLNDYGELGTASVPDTCGSDTCSLGPVPVSGGLAFGSVSANANYSCGVTTTGITYCWGADTSGKLGNGPNPGGAEPSAVVGSITFQAVSAGTHHACGLATNGDVYCWGYSDGLGGEEASDVPVLVFSP